MAGHYHNRSEAGAAANAAGSDVRSGAGLQVLRDRYYEYISTMRAGGGHLREFTAPCCQTLTQTLAPEDSDVWNTTCSCPWCGELYVKIVSHEDVKAFTPGRAKA